MKLIFKVILLVGGLVLLTCLVADAVNSKQGKASTKSSLAQDILNIFDANDDKLLDPYEVLDVMLQMKSENNAQYISFDKVIAMVKERSNEREQELRELYSELDENRDSRVDASELPDFIHEFIHELDVNNDKIISFLELKEFNIETALSRSNAEILAEADDIFADFDDNDNGQLEDREVEGSRYDDNRDFDNDSRISKNELVESLKLENTTVSFKVDGNVAKMYGTIAADTPAKVLQLLFEHPEVDTIEMLRVPGSINDEANLRAAIYVQKFGLSTYLNSNSLVASGGTDFFLAGVERKVDEGALIGIHSWATGDGTQGKDVPREDKQHRLYLDFYNKIGISEAFYWRTLEAAPAEDIHWMTAREIDTYNIATVK